MIKLKDYMTGTYCVLNAYFMELNSNSMFYFSKITMLFDDF